MPDTQFGGTDCGQIVTATVARYSVCCGTCDYKIKGRCFPSYSNLRSCLIMTYVGRGGESNPRLALWHKDLHRIVILYEKAAQWAMFCCVNS